VAFSRGLMVSPMADPRGDAKPPVFEKLACALIAMTPPIRADVQPRGRGRKVRVNGAGSGAKNPLENRLNMLGVISQIEFLFDLVG